MPSVNYTQIQSGQGNRGGSTEHCGGPTRPWPSREVVADPPAAEEVVYS